DFNTDESSDWNGTEPNSSSSSSNSGNDLTADTEDLGDFSSDSGNDRFGTKPTTDLGSGLTADADSLGDFNTDESSDWNGTEPNSSSSSSNSGNDLTADTEDLGDFSSDSDDDRSGTKPTTDLGSGLTADADSLGDFNTDESSDWSSTGPNSASDSANAGSELAVNPDKVSETTTTNTEERKNPNMWGTDNGKPFSNPTTVLGKIGEAIYDGVDGITEKIIGVSLTELGTYVSPDPQPVPEEVLTPAGSLNYNIMQGTPPVLGAGVVKTSETGARYAAKIADHEVTAGALDGAHILLTGETLTGKDAVPDSSPLSEPVGRIAIIGNNVIGARTGVEPLDVIIGVTGYNPITGEKEDRIPSLFGISKGVKGGQKGAPKDSSDGQKK
ncbi:hypothetical protein ACVRXQ_13085, partial [Streptococcus panodentis]